MRQQNCFSFHLLKTRFCEEKTWTSAPNFLFNDTHFRRRQLQKYSKSFFENVFDAWLVDLAPANDDDGTSRLCKILFQWSQLIYVFSVISGMRILNAFMVADMIFQKLSMTLDILKKLFKIWERENTLSPFLVWWVLLKTVKPHYQVVKNISFYSKKWNANRTKVYQHSQGLRIMSGHKFGGYWVRQRRWPKAVALKPVNLSSNLSDCCFKWAMPGLFLLILGLFK